MANRTQQVRQVARPRKRAQPPVFGGVTGSYEDKDSDYLWYDYEYFSLALLKWGLMHVR